MNYKERMDALKKRRIEEWHFRPSKCCANCGYFVDANGYNQCNRVDDRTTYSMICDKWRVDHDSMLLL